MRNLLGAIAIAVLLCGCHSRHTTRITENNFFPITPWEVPATKRELLGHPVHGISSLRDCGFTVAAFVTPDQLPLVQKAGLRALVGLPGQTVKLKDLSDEQIAARMKMLVDQTRGNGAVMGYFLQDEPGVGAFEKLAVAVAAIKKLAPGKLAYINLYPNYATLGAPDLSQLGTANYTEYLERYVAEVKPQFISYDNYRLLLSKDLAEPKLAESYFTNLLEVRRVAQKHGLPFWNIVSSNQIRPHTTVPSPANLLFQAYTTLAAGGRGLSWFTYYIGRYQYAPIDAAGNRTATWTYLKMVNEQVRTLGPIMNRLRSTGVFFTAPPAPSLPALPGKLIASIDSSTPVMIGEFAGEGGETYVMVVNLSLERSTKLTLKTTQPAKRIEAFSPADGSLAPIESDSSLWLSAGQGMLLKLN